MPNKYLLFIVLLSVTLLSCRQNDHKNKNRTTSQHNDTLTIASHLSTTYQIAPDYVAEIIYNQAAGALEVSVNNAKCIDNFNSPNKNQKISIEINDYNFDGYKDFAIVAEQQYYINLFNPQDTTYKPFNTLPLLYVDTINKRLLSSNHSDGKIFTDIYEPDESRKLKLKERWVDTDYSLLTIKNGIIGDLTTIREIAYINTKGDTVKKATQLLDSNQQVATYIIENTKEYLYRSPDKNARTTMYLVKGDKVVLMDIANGFFKVKFKNAKYGDIIKWIKYNSAD